MKDAKKCYKVISALSGLVIVVKATNYSRAMAKGRKHFDHSCYVAS